MLTHNLEQSRDFCEGMDPADMTPSGLVSYIHNQISPESIHLAIADLEGPELDELSLPDFLQMLYANGMANDNARYAKRRV